MEIDKRASDTTDNRSKFLNDEAYYKEIVDSLTELICRCNSDNNLTFVNGAFCNYIHLKRKDIIGQSFMDVIHEKDRDFFQALLSSLDRKNPVATAENRVTLPNRDVLWQQWTIRAIFDDKGIIVEYQSVGRDVTERMQTEKFLHESKKNYEKLANNANDAIAIIMGKDGRHVFVNKPMEEISGYSQSDLLKMSFREVINPDELGRINQRYIKELAGKQFANRFETKLVDKQGMVVPVEISSSMTDWRGQAAVLAIIRDITLRKQMEESLRISENDFRAMAENANNGFILATGEGVHVYSNERFAQISGYSVAELLKIGFKELTPLYEVESIMKKYQKRLAGEDVPAHYETHLVRKDGVIIPIEVSASKTTWHGKPVVLEIISDISDRKKEEEQQKRAHDELERLVDERTSELVGAAKELELKHNELLLHRSELEKVNQELLDTNKALMALARNIDREREDAEKRIAKIVRSRMLPLLEDFQKNASFKKYRAEINELMLSLYQLTPGLKKDTDIILLLSATELRIATMIKNGITSPKIANVLHISLDTVKSHRRNIRRKLKLNNSRINLASYFEAKM